jgi:hypothetical protein
MGDKKTKAIFIGGAGHSGTSMLFRIFSQHPKSLSIKSESRIAEAFELLENKYNKISSLEDKVSFIEKTAFYGTIFKKQKYEYVNNQKNLLAGSLTTEDISGVFHEDYRKLILKSLEKNDLNFIVEKTPSNVFHLKEISKLCEDFKLVIIHRDVRDVVASLKKRYMTLIESPEVFSHNLEIKKLDKDYNLVIDSILWNKIVLRSLKDVSIHGNDNIKIVSYEEFVNNPSKIIKSLCQWLAIDYDEEMLNLKSRNSANLNYKNLSGISANSVGNYKNILDIEEISIIEKYAEKGMKELNLEFHNQKINHLKKLKYEVKSYFKILIRMKKRLTLMETRYALDFSKRFLNKLFKN